MNIFTKSRLAGLFIVLLIMVNILSLGTLWAIYGGGEGERSSRRGGHDRQREQQFLSRELGLDEEQETVMQELRDRHFNEMEPLLEELKEKQEFLAEIAFAPETDEEKLHVVASEIGRLTAEMTLLKYNYLRDMKALCSEEQGENFAELMQEMHGGSGRPQGHGQGRGQSRGQGRWQGQGRERGELNTRTESNRHQVTETHSEEWTPPGQQHGEEPGGEDDGLGWIESEDFWDDDF